MDNQHKHRRRFGARVLVGAVVVGAVVLVALRHNPLDGEARYAEKQPVFTVERRPLTISVIESGTIKARDQIVIKNEVEGKTTILSLVAEGDHVNKGDLLIELDASKLEDNKVDQEISVLNAEADVIRSREALEVVKTNSASKIDQAELALRFAREDLKKFIEGDFPKRVKEAEVKVTLAEEELSRAREKVNWSKVLFKEKYLSQSELQSDELSFNKARLNLELARADLDLLRDFTYQRELAKLESDVKQNVLALERAQREAKADQVQAEANLRARQSELDRQKRKLEKTEEQIAQTKIIAPADGMVIYATSSRATWRGNVTPLDEGQEVRERQDLIYLPTGKSFMADVEVHETSLKKISPGLPARLTVDALPGKTFDGTVGKIAPVPDGHSMFLNPDLKVYPTEVLINNESSELKTGMSCQVEIIIEQLEDAFFVPLQAVIRVEGEPTVYVKGPAGWESRSVVLGLDNNRMVQVVSGLSEGEQVLLTPPLEEAEIKDAPETTGQSRSDLTSLGQE